MAVCPKFKIGQILFLSRRDWYIIVPPASCHDTDLILVTTSIKFEPCWLAIYTIYTSNIVKYIYICIYIYIYIVTRSAVVTFSRQVD